MNMWTGLTMLAAAVTLILIGRPNREGIHPKLLRFEAAVVLYPPVILTLAVFGAAAVISELTK